MIVAKKSVLALGALFSVATVHALSVGDKVDNFRLLDHTGVSQELYYRSDMKAIVLLAHSNECKHAGGNAAALQSLRDRWQKQGADFLLIDSSLQDTRQLVVEAAAKAGITMPVLLDDTQLVGESLGFHKSGAALVINPKNWQVVYRGNPADSNNAVASLIAGTAVTKVKSKASGCAIKMPEHKRHRAHARISYEKTIAPILIDNCVTCHRQGGIGPWQMSNYDVVRGFAPMIREVLRTERMPPWHADPHYNAFSNNRSLSKEQVKTVVHWIEAGAPRGNGSDPLAELKKTWPEWVLGKPDLIVEIPAYDVPATGVVPYQMPSAANPLDREVWVRAVDFLPGDRTVLHHILASVGTDARGIRDGGDLGNFVPGARPLVEPDNAGMLLKPGTRFFFQMHYTVSGKAATDASRMGLYFRKDPPQYEMRSMVLANPRLKIPANTKEYTESYTRAITRDILVYTLLPHAHFRGRAATFYVEYPDGRKETLLSVPKYEFNWQTTYELTMPKLLPAGSKLTHTMTWDNSSQNKANPDHNRIVPWGEQTWDEMLYGVVRYRFVDEVVKAASASP